MAKILVVDDERSIRNTLKELLEMENHTVSIAENGIQALEIVGKINPDLVISDIKMPGMDGIDLLRTILEEYPETNVLMISGHGTIDTAVESIKLGAIDFVEKPIEMNRFLLTVRNALSNTKLTKENKVLRRKIAIVSGYEIIGNSKEILTIKALIKKVAATDAKVLITGSNGTGKELVARQLHLQSARAAAPFIEVNCAAIPHDLIESELFGHEKGSFTTALKQRKGKFEQGEGGTIFLDEIGDMSLSAQAKVLRALQEKKISKVGSEADISVNVRVIAATNKDLTAEIAAGRFREDLYHRLSVIKIHIPSLGERKEDIAPLAEHFLHQVCQEQSCGIIKIEPSALQLLEKQPFTGNVRELRNVIERLVILCNGERITVEDVTEYVCQ